MDCGTHQTAWQNPLPLLADYRSVGVAFGSPPADEAVDADELRTEFGVPALDRSPNSKMQRESKGQCFRGKLNQIEISNQVS